MLVVADDFDRAIEARPESIATTPGSMASLPSIASSAMLLESEGVTPDRRRSRQAFDPREHEAIANVPGTGRAEGEIVEEVRRGYRLRDRVLRPALVAVAAGDADDNH